MSSGHRLGFAVKVLGEGGLPSHDTRRWQSGPHLSVSLERLRAVLTYADRNDIRMYRMPTALAPYASHPELPRFHSQVAECADELRAVGALATRLGIRLSTHPGQYTVLNSEREEVRDAAVAELEVQGALFDAMDLPEEAVVVIHVGGKAGGIRAAQDRFCRGFEALSERARQRVVIENDDRAFAIGEVVMLARRLGIPAVWDSLHHRCHDPERLSDRDALELALSTWAPGVVPKVHVSSPRLDVGERKRRAGRRVERRLVMPELRSHADLIDPIAFEALAVDALDGHRVDVMLEAKAKDLALIRLREQLLARGFGWDGGILSVPGSSSSTQPARLS